RSLMVLDDPEPAAPLPEEIADDAPAVAKMTMRIGVCEEGAGFKMRVARRDPVNQRPERTNVSRAVAPSRKIGVAVNKGEGRREVEADEHVGARCRHILEPVPDLGS